DDLICKDPKTYAELVNYLATSLGIEVADVERGPEEKPASIAALVQAPLADIEDDRVDAEIERKRKQNDALEAELERSAELNRKLKALRDERETLKATEKTVAPVKKKGGWQKGKKRGPKPKPPAEPQTVSLDEFSNGER